MALLYILWVDAIRNNYVGEIGKEAATKSVPDSRQGIKPETLGCMQSGPREDSAAGE